MSNTTFQIVLVEDSDADVYLFRRALESAGLDVSLTVIEDGAEALAFARGRKEYAGSPRPDLVVLDLNLPKHAGVEVLEEMRRSAELANTPVAILSSSPTPGEQLRVKELGAELTIAKPLGLEEFLEIGGMLKKVLLEAKARRGSAPL